MSVKLKPLRNGFKQAQDNMGIREFVGAFLHWSTMSNVFYINQHRVCQS